MLDLLLYIAAAICFFLATINIAAKINLIGLGLFLFVLTYILPW